jgi:glycosyltransferase involved in cell wall biosynthesis
MKIIHISVSNGRGGAAIATKRLNKALQNEDHDSRIWVNYKYGKNPNIKTYSNNILKRNYRLKRYISRALVLLLKTSNPVLHSPQIFSSSFWLKAINESDADIVHLHWFQHEMISVSDLSKIKKPLVWTLHDMWGFCGAEHISYDNRWNEGYFKSNRPLGEGRFDLNRWTWNRKRKYWKKPINIITPSIWMKQNVKKSYLMKNWPVYSISNSLDTKKWKAIDKKSSRKKFKLPNELSLVLFGSTSGTKDYHKGFDLLEKSLEKLGNVNKKIGLVIFGEDEPEVKPNFKFPVFYLGFLQNSKSLIAAYSAVDLVLIPSRIESFGQVAAEANACSCPVVAFNTSGLGTTVKHKFSGYLANAFDTDDFLKGILWVLNNNTQKLKSDCRKHVLENFSSKKIALEHIKLYEKIIKDYIN